MRKPKLLAHAEFTADMADTLVENFHTYCVDGIVTLEVTDRGIWIKNPEGGQQFLGSARVFPKDTPSQLN